MSESWCARGRAETKSSLAASSSGTARRCRHSFDWPRHWRGPCWLCRTCPECRGRLMAEPVVSAAPLLSSSVGSSADSRGPRRTELGRDHPGRDQIQCCSVEWSAAAASYPSSGQSTHFHTNPFVSSKRQSDAGYPPFDFFGDLGTGRWSTTSKTFVLVAIFTNSGLDCWRPCLWRTRGSWGADQVDYWISSTASLGRLWGMQVCSPIAITLRISTSVSTAEFNCPGSEILAAWPPPPHFFCSYHAEFGQLRPNSRSTEAAYHYAIHSTFSIVEIC